MPNVFGKRDVSGHLFYVGEVEHSLRNLLLTKTSSLSCHPFPNLSLISKIMCSQISSNWLSSSNLQNRYQSAYCKQHSSETALYTDDHLIHAKNLQTISCLCLIDFSDDTVLLVCLIGLQQQLAKIYSCSLITFHPAHSVGSLCMHVAVMICATLVNTQTHTHSC